MKLRPIIDNKKGDIQSLIVVVMLIFVIGIVFVMMNNLNDKLFTKMYNNLNESKTLNDSSALSAITKIQTVDNSVWDYAFLGIFFGAVISLGLTAYATKISPVFFWIYVIMSMLVLLIATMLSNTWQAMAVNPSMVDTIARFPITNFILGTYYPTVFTAMLLIFLILLFAKTPEQGSPY